jgi:hypothetical protein
MLREGECKHLKKKMAPPSLSISKSAATQFLVSISESATTPFSAVNL